MSEDLYEALGVDKDATPEDIQRAYRKAAKASHPDTGGDIDKFALISLAKDVLSDPERRKKYDRTGDAEGRTIDNTEQKGRQLAWQAVEMHIAAAEQHGIDPVTVDLIGDSIDALKKAVGKMEAEHAKTLKTVAKAKKLLGRFKARRGKEDILSVMLEHKIRAIEDAAEKILEDRPAHLRAIEILKDHTFRRDEPPPRTERPRAPPIAMDWLIRGV